MCDGDVVWVYQSATKKERQGVLVRGGYAGCGQERYEETYEGMLVDWETSRDILAIGHVRRGNALGCSDKSVTIGCWGEMYRGPNDHEQRDAPRWMSWREAAIRSSEGRPTGV